MDNKYKTKLVEELPVGSIDRIELFRITDKTIISEVGWPDSFWQGTHDIQRINKPEKVQQIISLLNGLEPGPPARCHMPPWGLAAFQKSNVLFTATICFECTNIYVYTSGKKQLHGFDVSNLHAEELLGLLKKHFPLCCGETL